MNHYYNNCHCRESGNFIVTLVRDPDVVKDISIDRKIPVDKDVLNIDSVKQIRKLSYFKALRRTRLETVLNKIGRRAAS